MGKNEREKQMLLDWSAQNNQQDDFRMIDQKENSYFIKRETDADQSPYIREYGFETLPEFLKELDILWGDDERMMAVKKITGVAAIKNKPSKGIGQETVVETKEETEDKLPAFIYNF